MHSNFQQGHSFCEIDKYEITLEKAKHGAEAGYVLVGGQRLRAWEIGTPALLFDKW